MCAVVRTHGDPRALSARVRDTIRRAEPTLVVLKIDTVDEQLDDVLAQDRLVAGLSAFFATAVGLLCCLGLYALIAHMVAVRTREIGVRLALGATRERVLTLVLKEGLLLAAAGVVIGLPATLAMGQLIASLLFGVDAIDPPTIVTASVTMTAVATLAGYLPARGGRRGSIRW
jgi:ABC-type antimicrobial peptide transport system permease subunit